MILKRFFSLRGGIAAGTMAAMALLFGSSAQAQAPPPSYAVHQESIVGIVRSFDGQYTMYVRDQRGNLDRVELHQGTIINPTGLTLQSGMHVTVYGHPAGPVFVADEIDTPYRYMPYPYPYAYPYPAWGFGVNWGWGWHHRCC